MYFSVRNLDIYFSKLLINFEILGFYINYIHLLTYTYIIIGILYKYISGHLNYKEVKLIDFTFYIFYTM